MISNLKPELDSPGGRFLSLRSQYPQGRKLHLCRGRTDAVGQVDDCCRTRVHGPRILEERLQIGEAAAVIAFRLETASSEALYPLDTAVGIEYGKRAVASP